MLSSYNLLKQVSWVLSPLCVLGICIPSIKFRLSTSESENLRRDPSYRSFDEGVCLAQFTNRSISPLNIGIVGTIRNAELQEVSERMADRPNKVLIGIAELAMASWLAFMAYTSSDETDTTSVISYIAGMCLGFI